MLFCQTICQVTLTKLEKIQNRTARKDETDLCQLELSQCQCFNENKQL